MAKTTSAKSVLEREYVIPLRREWLKVPRYKRTGKGIKAIKEFVAKHMRVEDRDVDKVKIDMYLNNEIWFKGGRKPPSKVKVKAIKLDDGNVRVEFVEVPERIKFAKAIQERRHKKGEKREVKEEKDQKLEEKLEEKSEQEKKEEKEKEQAGAQVKESIMEKQMKAQKHIAVDKAKGMGKSTQRMALQK